MRSWSKWLLPAWCWCGWFGCIILAQHDLALLSLFFPLVAWLLYVAGTRPSLAESGKLAILALIGLCFDTSAYRLGGIRFEPPPSGLPLPIWMLSLWFLFAPSLTTLSAAFARRYAIAAIAGGVFGPLSYASGQKFGLLFFNSAWAVACYVAFWACLVPASVYWIGSGKVENTHKS